MGKVGTGKAPVARRLVKQGMSKSAVAKRLGIRPQQVDNATAYSKKNPHSGGGLRMRARNYGKATTAKGVHHKNIVGSKTLKCRTCGKAVRGRNAHVDHKKPLSKGGSNAGSNLRVLCRDCNLKRNTGHGPRRRV